MPGQDHILARSQFAAEFVAAEHPRDVVMQRVRRGLPQAPIHFDRVGGDDGRTRRRLHGHYLEAGGVAADEVHRDPRKEFAATFRAGVGR